MTKAGVPKKGTTWVDALGRVLVVKKVVKADPLGRQVQGRITYNPTGRRGANREADYSCGLKIFEHIWKNCAKPAEAVEVLKGGGN